MDVAVELREIADEFERQRALVARLIESAKCVCRIMPTKNDQSLKDSALAELRSILAEIEGE